MKTNSVIRLADLHENKNAYRTASKEYYTVYVLDAEGVFVPCLLTEDDITSGVDRAVKNVEDILPLALLQLLYHKALLKLESICLRVRTFFERFK